MTSCFVIRSSLCHIKCTEQCGDWDCHSRNRVHLSSIFPIFFFFRSLGCSFKVLGWLGRILTSEFKVVWSLHWWVLWGMGRFSVAQSILPGWTNSGTIVARKSWHDSASPASFSGRAVRLLAITTWWIWSEEQWANALVRTSIISWSPINVLLVGHINTSVTSSAVSKKE